MGLSILSYSLIIYSFIILMIHLFIFDFKSHLFNLILKLNILLYYNFNSHTYFYFILFFPILNFCLIIFHKCLLP